MLREGRGAGRAEAQTDGQQAQRVAEGRGEGCAASGRRMEEQRKGSEPNQRARLCDRLHAKKCQVDISWLPRTNERANRSIVFTKHAARPVETAE